MERKIKFWLFIFFCFEVTAYLSCIVPDLLLGAVISRAIFFVSFSAIITREVFNYPLIAYKSRRTIHALIIAGSCFCASDLLLEGYGFGRMATIFLGMAIILAVVLLRALLSDDTDTQQT